MNKASSCSADVTKLSPHQGSITKQDDRFATWAARIFYQRKPCRPATAAVLHYFACFNAFRSPEGGPYIDTWENLNLLTRSLEHARLLHLVPPNAILEPNPYIEHIPRIQTIIDCNSKQDQPTSPHIEIWAENTQAGYLFEPIARNLCIPLLASPANFTFTTLWELVRRAAIIRRPIKIIYLSDRPDSLISFRLRLLRISKAFSRPRGLQIIDPSCTARLPLEAQHAQDPSSPENNVRKIIAQLRTAAP